jgi:cell division ATPase FtsA
MVRPYANHALSEDITQLKTSLTVNNNNIPLNDFTQRYIANMLSAMANSFGVDSNKVTVSLNAEEFNILTENGEIDVSKKDFARQLIESTIKGMLSPLKGVFWTPDIIISSERIQD